MILAHRVGILSTRRLRDAIQELTGRRYLITTNPDKVKKLHIRYGSYAETLSKTDYNNRSFVRLCCDKDSFSRIITKAGFDAPIFNLNVPSQNDYPLLIRKTLYGYGGKDIVPCANEDDFEKNWQLGDYWTKFIFTSSEYRVIVVNGEVVRVFKKIYSGTDEEPNLPIRTLTSGQYHYSLRSHSSKFSKLHEEVYNLQKVIQGSFYALDAGWQRDLNKYCFFEANSAPGLNMNSAFELAKRLHDLGVV